MDRKGVVGAGRKRLHGLVEKGQDFAGWNLT